MIIESGVVLDVTGCLALVNLTLGIIIGIQLSQILWRKIL